MSANENVTEILQDLAVDNPEMQPAIKEALNRVNAMLQLEDRGWLDAFSGVISGDDVPGPDLKLVQESSALAREMSYGSPLITRGLELRQSYVWSKGIHIAGAPDATKPEDSKKRGPKGRKERFFSEPSIRRYLLSDDAHSDMESSAYTDGHFMFLGDDTTKTGHPVPFYEIDGVFLNPSYSGEVWAYRRTYTEHKTDGSSETKTRWYYVDTYTGVREELETKKDGAKVDKDKTLFVKAFNTLTGWPLGLPDSLPALKDARAYSEMKNDGRVVSKANAKFSYKVKNNTAQGAQNAAAKVSSSPGVGNVAALGDNNDLVAIPQANRAYDFNGLRPIAAQVATALSVSVVHLLSDPGAAGSSYGSASNLDLPTKRVMVSRQGAWVEFLERVLKWGTGEDLKVTFPSLDDPDPYREMQLVTMGWNAGVIHPDEMRARTVTIGGFVTTETEPPEGVLIPNNEASLARKDIDTDSSGVASTASSPDQGATNGTGGVSDSVAKDLATEAMLIRMEEMSRQMEAIAQMIEARDSL